MVTFILLVVGGLNWLLYAFDFGIGQYTDLISPRLTQAIYVLVGLSAIYELLTHKRSCKESDVSGSGSGSGSMGGGMGGM